MKVLNSKDLASFRRSVATLKKAGLIPPNKKGKSVSAKTARPGDMYQGKPLREYVRDRDNKLVLEGQAVALPKSKVADTQGFKIKRLKGGLTDRVIVPVPKDASVSIEKKNIVIRHEKGEGAVTRTMLPRKNLEQYLQDATKLPELSGRSYYAFYFFGNRSHQIFRNAEDLVEYLQGYGTVENADSRSKQTEIFRNLEVIQIQDAGEWRGAVADAIRRKRQGNRTYSQRKKSRKAQPAFKQAAFKETKAEEQRKRRASLSEAKKNKERKKNRERMRKKRAK